MEGVAPIAETSETFDELVAIHRQRIFRFALASLRDRDAAESVTQDCFLRAWQAWPQFRGDSSVQTWLTRIAINLIRDAARSRRFQFWKQADTTDTFIPDATVDFSNRPHNPSEAYFNYVQTLGDLNVFQSPSTVTGYPGCTSCVFGENNTILRSQMAIWTVTGMGLVPESVLNINTPTGPNVWSTLPTITVPFTFTIYNQTYNGLPDAAQWGQFLLQSRSAGDAIQGPLYCYGAWAEASGTAYLNLDLNAPPGQQVTGYNNPLADTFCTVSLFSVTSLPNGNGVQATVYFTFTPSAEGATYNVFHEVIYSQGEEPWENVGMLTVQTPPSPVITGIYPTSGGVGSTVTISGSNFGYGTPTVMFSGMSTGAVLNSWSSTSITAVIPAGATTGSIEVECSGGNNSSPAFTVTINPAPVINLIVQQAPLYPGTWGTVQIYGYNFGNSAQNGSGLQICPNGANPCVLPDVDDFPCNAIDRNGQIACASFFYDVWQDNYIQAEILLSNGYEYYPTWQLSVTAAGAWLSNQFVAFAVATPPCAVPVKFNQVGLGVDHGATTYLDTGLPDVELSFSYQFESSTHNLSDIQACSIGEIVTYPGGNPYSPSSPPFPPNTYMVQSNPFFPEYTVNQLSNGLFDRHNTVGSWVQPYTSNANYVSTQYYRYRCGCLNNNAYVNFVGPLQINHALTNNGDGTWRYAICKPNISPYNQNDPPSCANLNPLPH